MERCDVIEMFGAITQMFPRDTAFANATDKMITAWWEMLSDLPKNAVSVALKRHAAISQFAPSIAEIRKAVTDMTASDGRTGLDEWNDVAKALRNSAYDSAEQFRKLSPIAQRLVGSPMQLKEWGCAEDAATISVAKSQFLKGYEILKRRENETKQLPESIRYLLTGLDPVKELVEQITEEI